MDNRPSRGIYLTARIAALGGLLIGYDTGVINGTQLFLRGAFRLSPGMQEVVVTIALLGAIAGSLAGGILADRYGRRRMLITAAFLFAGGALASALAENLTWLLTSRGIVGAALGIVAIIAPLYIAEAAPAALRGRLVTFNQIALTSGIMVSFLVDYAFAPFQGWRWMFGLALIPALALGIGMSCLPKNSRWLARRRAIVQTHGANNGPRPQSSIQVVLNPAVLPAVMTGVVLAILQQITGMYTIIYYTPAIFLAAGFASARDAVLAMIVVGLVNVLGTMIAAMLVDRAGRRPLLLAGLAGMVLSLVMLGVAFAVPHLSPALGWLAVISLLLYITAYAIGLGSIFWLLIAEIYPLPVRGLAMSIAAAVNWTANYAVALTYFSLILRFGRAWTFWLYAIVGVIAWVFVYRFVPETKGMSLEQIEDQWRAGEDPRAMRA